jgi:hypothetical protein
MPASAADCRTSTLTPSTSRRNAAPWAQASRRPLSAPSGIPTSSTAWPPTTSATGRRRPAPLRPRPGIPLTNFTSDILARGTYRTAGTFKFAGAAITTDAANIILDGPGAQIVNQLGADALANLSQIEEERDRGHSKFFATASGRSSPEDISLTRIPALRRRTCLNS